MNHIRFHLPKGSSWIAALVQDFKWLASSEIYREYYLYTIPQWVGVVKVDPKLFISNVRKFANTPFANLYSFIPINSNPDPPFALDDIPPIPVAITNESFQCTICSHLPFQTKQQLMTHMCAAHRVKHDILVRVSTTHCEICLIQFHSRARLLQHLKKKPKNICRENYFDFPPCYTADQLKEVDELEAVNHRKLYAAALRAYHAEKPCYSLLGCFRDIKYVTRPSKHHPLGKGYQYRT